MHSQGTDYTSVCLDAECNTRLMLSASIDRSGNEWVTAHSLEIDTLLVRGRAGVRLHAHPLSLLPLCARLGLITPAASLWVSFGAGEMFCLQALAGCWLDLSLILLRLCRHPRDASPCPTAPPERLPGRTASRLRRCMALVGR